jgi:dipeptidase
MVPSTRGSVPGRNPTSGITSNAASSWLAADYAPLEATRYATRTFKRLMYHTCENPDTFLQPVTAEIEAFEADLLREQRRIERRAAARLNSGRSDQAGQLLTAYVETRLLDSLDLGEDLVRVVEEHTRDKFGIRMPTGRDLPGETYRPESQSMNRGDGLEGAANSIVHCYREELDDYPREHGSYADQTGELLDVASPGLDDVAPERLADALRSAREDHDPDEDWDAFVDAVLRDLGGRS